MSDFSNLSDAEINEKVAEALGWTEIHPCVFYSRLDIVDHYGYTGFNPNDNDSLHVACEIPNYCNEANAYMPLVDKMEDQLPTLRPSTNSEGVWQCSLQRSICEGVGTSIGRAICECFLKFHESKNPPALP